MKRHQQQTLAWLNGLTARNPLTVSRWLLCWAAIGIYSGLFAGLYWHILEQLTKFLSSFQAPISTTLLLTGLTGFTPFTPILFASLVGFFLSPKIPLIKSQLIPFLHEDAHYYS